MPERADLRGTSHPPEAVLGKRTEKALADFEEHLVATGLGEEEAHGHVGRLRVLAQHRRSHGRRGDLEGLTPGELAEYMGIWFPLRNLRGPMEEVGLTLGAIGSWCRYLHVRGSLTEGDLAILRTALDLVDLYEGRCEALRATWAGDGSGLEDVLEWMASFDPAEVSLLAAEAVPGHPEGVYAFKVWMRRRRGLWREIEVLGSQPLSALDGEIQDAFGHEWGHLSEFRVRGATIGPSGAEGFDLTTDVHVSSLGLARGDHFDYTYDFGDMLEHVGELLEVRERGEGVEYPRVARRSRPRHWYCARCSPAGMSRRDRRVALHVCTECGLRLCGDCADGHGDDVHRLEEIIY